MKTATSKTNHKIINDKFSPKITDEFEYEQREAEISERERATKYSPFSDSMEYHESFA